MMKKIILIFIVLNFLLSACTVAIPIIEIKNNDSTCTIGVNIVSDIQISTEGEFDVAVINFDAIVKTKNCNYSNFALPLRNSTPEPSIFPFEIP